MMTTTTIPSPTEPASARQRNEGLWKQMSSLYHAKRVEDALAYWHEDARYEAAFPVAGLPAVVEGRAALTEMFAALVSLAERIEVRDRRFHQTGDPDVAFVEERFIADLAGGGRYDNRTVMRITFRDGLIAEMLEYAGQHENEALLGRIRLAG